MTKNPLMKQITLEDELKDVREQNMHLMAEYIKVQKGNTELCTVMAYLLLACGGEVRVPKAILDLKRKEHEIKTFEEPETGDQIISIKEATK